MVALRTWAQDEYQDKLGQQLDTSSWPIRCSPAVHRRACSYQPGQHVHLRRPAHRTHLPPDLCPPRPLPAPGGKALGGLALCRGRAGRRYPRVPQQGNGHDCGMFTLAFADAASRQAKFDFSQRDMAKLRLRVAADIVSLRVA